MDIEEEHSDTEDTELGTHSEHVDAENKHKYDEDVDTDSDNGNDTDTELENGNGADTQPESQRMARQCCLCECSTTLRYLAQTRTMATVRTQS